LNYVDDTG